MAVNDIDVLVGDKYKDLDPLSKIVMDATARVFDVGVPSSSPAIAHKSDIWISDMRLINDLNELRSFIDIDEFLNAINLFKNNYITSLVADMGSLIADENLPDNIPDFAKARILAEKFPAGVRDFYVEALSHLGLKVKFFTDIEKIIPATKQEAALIEALSAEFKDDEGWLSFSFVLDALATSYNLTYSDDLKKTHPGSSWAFIYMDDLDTAAALEEDDYSRQYIGFISEDNFLEDYHSAVFANIMNKDFLSGDVFVREGRLDKFLFSYPERALEVILIPAYLDNKYEYFLYSLLDNELIERADLFAFYAVKAGDYGSLVLEYEIPDGLEINGIKVTEKHIDTVFSGVPIKDLFV